MLKSTIIVTPHAPDSRRSTTQESLVGAFGLPGLRPPIRRRTFNVRNMKILVVAFILSLLLMKYTLFVMALKYNFFSMIVLSLIISIPTFTFFF